MRRNMAAGHCLMAIWFVILFCALFAQAEKIETIGAQVREVRSAE